LTQLSKALCIISKLVGNIAKLENLFYRRKVMSDPVTFGSLERVPASEACSQGGRKPEMPYLVGQPKLQTQQESVADTSHPSSSKYNDSVSAHGYPMVAARNGPGGTGIHDAEAMPQTPILQRPDSFPRESDRSSMGYVSHTMANKVNRNYQGGPNNAREFRMATGHPVRSVEVDHSVPYPNPYYYYCYYSSMAPPTQHSISSFDMRDERRKGGNYGAQDMDDLKRLVVDAMEGEIEGILKNASFVPRQNAFTCLLQLTGKCRQGDKAIEVFEVMRGSCGISPNTFSYSALISALARSGQWEAAERYFKEMKDAASENDECRPNTVTYASMISGEFKIRLQVLRVVQRRMDTKRHDHVLNCEPETLQCTHTISVFSDVQHMKRQEN
jgi:pentatricopeptide repeat protein